RSRQDAGPVLADANLRPCPRCKTTHPQTYPASAATTAPVPFCPRAAGPPIAALPLACSTERGRGTGPAANPDLPAGRSAANVLAVSCPHVETPPTTSRRGPQATARG